MKRSSALVELSREHHGALSLALHARRAAAEGEASAAAMAATAVERFHCELKPHFDEEEGWLLPALAQAGESALAARARREHAEIAELVARLRVPDAATLGRFADCLAAHVRFEERELFPAAEQQAGCLAGR